MNIHIKLIQKWYVAWNTRLSITCWWLEWAANSNTYVVLGISVTTLDNWLKQRGLHDLLTCLSVDNNVNVGVSWVSDVGGWGEEEEEEVSLTTGSRLSVTTNTIAGLGGNLSHSTMHQQTIRHGKAERF